MRSLLLILVLLALIHPASGQVDVARATAIFAETDSMLEAEDGRVWGHRLDGPLIFVDPADRSAVSNHAVPGFVARDGVWLGQLPDSIGIANTAFNWGTARWSMVRWPLPEDRVARARLVAHELWHRIQDELGFPSAGPENAHLDTRDGRYLIQLEWRALSRALRSDGLERRSNLAAALGFRQQRLELAAGAAESERDLLMHEGLAQYTGLAVAVSDPDDRAELAARDLDSAPESPSFVRSFAYATGAAYGVLADDLKPGWRTAASLENPLPELLDQSPARAIPELFDDGSLAAREDSLAEAKAERRAELLVRFVEGPLLLLDFERMNVQFDPGRVETLEDHGQVYPGMTLRDVWGTLTAPGSALIRAGWGGAVVPAPHDPTARRLEGEGYVLELADGWTLQPGKRDGDWRVVRR